MLKTIDLNDVFDTIWTSSLGVNFLHYWKEEDDNFVLAICVPGIKKKDLSVKIKREESIIIKGTTDTKSINKEYLIPQDANVSKLIAKLEDGILTIKIPKETNEKEVEIE